MHCIDVTLSPQFDCCGVDNASDWLRYNNESVLDNNLVLPAGCSCDLDDNGCIAFNATLYNGTTLIEATFEAWEDVSKLTKMLCSLNAPCSTTLSSPHCVLFLLHTPLHTFVHLGMSHTF